MLPPKDPRKDDEDEPAFESEDQDELEDEEDEAEDEEDEAENGR
jgi:hypothetical protein